MYAADLPTPLGRGTHPAQRAISVFLGRDPDQVRQSAMIPETQWPREAIARCRRGLDTQADVVQLKQVRVSRQGPPRETDPRNDIIGIYEGIVVWTG